MPQPKKVSKNSTDQLLSLGIRNVGFERYEGDRATVEGLKDDPDARWRVTFKKTGKIVYCCTLVEAVNVLKATAS